MINVKVPILLILIITITTYLLSLKDTSTDMVRKRFLFCIPVSIMFYELIISLFRI